MAYSPIVVVDEHDNEIGTAMLPDVLKKGLYHRISSVFVEDEDGRMLLQLRAPNVMVYPNCWDQAAGGHVDKGQTYDTAARNELAEELGLHDVTLKPLGTFKSNDTLDDGRTVNQFERCYMARVPRGVALHPAEDEIASLRWFTRAELKTLIGTKPGELAPGLLQGLRTFFPELWS